MKLPLLLVQPAFLAHPAVPRTHSLTSISQAGPSYLHQSDTVVPPVAAAPPRHSYLAFRLPKPFTGKAFRYCCIRAEGLRNRLKSPYRAV